MGERYQWGEAKEQISTADRKEITDRESKGCRERSGVIFVLALALTVAAPSAVFAGPASDTASIRMEEAAAGAEAAALQTGGASTGAETGADLGGGAGDETAAAWESGAQEQPASVGSWQMQDNQWHYILADGTRKTGWLPDGDTWYYLDENGVMETGWRRIDGKYYYFRENGSMQNSTLRRNETQYTFNADGSFASAKKEKNTGGGSYPIEFFDSDLQAMADSLNELKADAFDGDEEEDYYEDDKKDYDKDASFVLNGKLQEIAEHRLAMARTKGYGSGKIPDEGTFKDYLASIGMSSARRSMEVYLMNCDGATHAEEKLLRNHDSDEKTRADRAVYYKEVGIAHEKVNDKDYYMIVFMR